MAQNTPFVPEAVAANGVLYGPANTYPDHLYTVAEMIPPRAPGEAWSLQTLYSSFPPNNYFSAGGISVALTKEGALYGTTSFLGSGPCSEDGIQVGCGTVFSLKAGASIIVKSSTNYSYSGQPITFTVAITPQNGDSATGKVTFYDGATALGTTAVSGNSASYSTSSLAPGSHRITAKYSGDANLTSSTSPVLRQTVSRTAFTTTTITSVTPNPADYHQTIVLNATVSGGTAPTGRVTFFYGTTATRLGTAILTGGSVSLTIPATKLQVGTYQVMASYARTPGYTASTSTAVPVTVNLGPTATSIVSSVNPSTKGQSVTFTATVSAQFGGKVTGSVTFSQGTRELKTVTLRAGSAAYTTTRLAKGPDTITATYKGSSEFAGSAGSVAQTVN